MSGGNGKWAPRPGHIPGAVVNLGGHDFVLAPLNLDAVRAFEDRAREVQDRLKDPSQARSEDFQLSAEMILASLKRNYPEFDLEHLKPLLDTHNVGLAMKAIADPSGLRWAKPGELGPTPS